jgi:GDP-L-fucose synthase
MSILITGGTGMLGRNLKDAAVSQGLEIFTPSRSEMNLASSDSVRNWLKQHRPDVIIHCAGHVGGIHANMADPLGFLTHNLDMGVNLVQIAHELNLPRLLNIGSSCMYPRNAINPLREEAILTGQLEPTNEGYALAKIVTAKLCEYIAAQSAQFCYRTVIPCNLYGRYDHFEAERSHLVPAVIRKVHAACVSGAPSIELWGDGTARREFMYAEDAAKMILACAQKMETLPQYMNLGLGHDHSVLEYYEAAAAVIGWSGGFDFDLTKPTGMKQKLVDISRQQEFGLQAVTSLADGMQKTYQYFLDSTPNAH